MRAFVLVSGVAAVLASCAYSLLGASSPWGGGSVLGLFDRLAAQDERAAALDVRRAALARSLDGKARAARAVADGRLTLLEAAATFRALQDAVPAYPWDVFRDDHPGASDGERLCRAVIGYVGEVLADGPDRAALVRRLEAELDGHLRDGTLRLPPVRGAG